MSAPKQEIFRKGDEEVVFEERNDRNSLKSESLHSTTIEMIMIMLQRAGFEQVT